MATPKRRRRTVLIFIVVFVVLILVFLLIRGCVERRREAVRSREATLNGLSSTDQSQTNSSGGSSSQAGGPDAQTGSAAQSGGSSSQPGDAAGQDEAGSGGQGDEDQQSQLAPQQEPPAQSSDGGYIPVDQAPNYIEIVEQKVTPYTSTPGHSMYFMAKVRGDAVSVTMSIADSSGGGGAFTVSLSPGVTSNGVTTWGFQGVSPSFAGTYGYTTTAVAADGHSVTAAGSQIIVQ